jgi:3-(3-hydroxy-phenyl)propionate hydroxylase
MFHQPALEHALRGLLTASPLADVRLGWAFEGLTVGADHVDVALRSADGTPRSVKARWLVGCDGAASPVRKALGVELDDYGFDEPWLVIDAVVRDGSAIPDLNLQICDPARPTTCVLMGPGRHRWEFMLKPGERPDDVLDDALIGRWLAPWGGPSALSIDRKAVYRFHGLVARSWRKSRVFLAGDAAHQMPPFLGQGMCSGLRDANNLAWKLAAVLHGEAGEALLDTYQTEREPNVRSIVEQAIAMGRIVCTTDPGVAAQRDAGMLAQREAGGGPRPPGAIPLLTQGCVLAGSPGAGTLFPQPWAEGTRLDDRLGEGPAVISRQTLGDLGALAAPVGAWLDRHGAEAVLVRPDRFVFGTGTPAGLWQAWTSRLSTP